MPRRNRKRRVRKRNMLSLYRPIRKSQPVPDHKVVTLRYVARFTLNASAASAAHHLFRANDLFAPDLTGGGYQPMAFDQWMVFYNRFTVIASKIKVTALSQGITSLTAGAALGIYLNDDTSSSNSLETLLEYRLTNWVPMSSTQGGHDIARISSAFNASKFFGKKNIVDSSQYSGTTAISPTEQAIYDVFVTPVDISDDLDPIDMVAEIEFKAVLTERKTLTSS